VSKEVPVYQPNILRRIPVPKFNQYHLYSSTSAIRWFIHCNKYGFNDKVVVRCGRGALIDEAAFFDCIDEQNGRR
jgi:hypothetical protein